MSNNFFDFPEPAPQEKIEELSLWATYYHVYRARAAEVGEPLLDRSGNPLGPKVSTKDWCKAAIEGTIAVEDRDKTTVYNYATVSRQTQVDCSRYTPRFPNGKIRWKLANGPFGDGVPPRPGAARMILVPFRSIAVDERQIPIPFQSVLYIPTARGYEITLPSGESVSHDGYFYAADTGGAIQNDHIDVFGGTSHDNPFPNFVRGENFRFPAFLIQNARISEILREMHRG
jgi:3D (Asp-Asp-Asp) domain-containing protein